MRPRGWVAEGGQPLCCWVREKGRNGCKYSGQSYKGMEGDVVDEEQDVEDDGGCLQASSRALRHRPRSFPVDCLIRQLPGPPRAAAKTQTAPFLPIPSPDRPKNSLGPESTSSFPIENGVCGLQPGQRRSHAHALSFSSSSPPGAHMPRCLVGASAVATARSPSHMRRSTSKPPKICFRVVARRPWLGSRWMSFIPGERLDSNYSHHRYRATTLPPPSALLQISFNRGLLLSVNLLLPFFSLPFDRAVSEVRIQA